MEYKFREREYNFDALRIFAMFMVITTHVADHYLTKTNFLVFSIYPFEGISHCADPLFLMLTGAFAMEKAGGGVNPLTFYKRFFQKLGIPTMIFACFYWAYDIAAGLISGSLENPLLLIAEDLATGFFRRYPHWYMSLITGIYFVLPFVARAKNSVDGNCWKKFVFIYFTWAILSMYTTQITASWAIGLSLSYFGYVILGNIIKDWGFKKSNKAGFFLIILGCLICTIDYCIIYFTVLDGGTYYNKYLWGYKAPLMIIGILLIYIGFCKVTIKTAIFSKIASTSFYVYLSHRLILQIISNRYSPVARKIETMLSGQYALIIPIMVALVFILSYLTALVCNKIQDFIWQKINKREKFYVRH